MPTKKTTSRLIFITVVLTLGLMFQSVEAGLLHRLTKVIKAPVVLTFITIKSYDNVLFGYWAHHWWTDREID